MTDKSNTQAAPSIQQAVQQALDALTAFDGGANRHGHTWQRSIIAQLQTALAAQPTPEPVAQADDTLRLDHLQSTGSTIEILLGDTKGASWRFRVGGLHAAVSSDIRAAIDTARGAQPGAPSPVALQGRDEPWQAVGEDDLTAIETAIMNGLVTDRDEAAGLVRAALVLGSDLLVSQPADQIPGLTKEQFGYALACARKVDEANATIAGLSSSAGHLSAMVDEQTRLVQKAVGIMKALHESATPIDGPDMDAQIPGHAFHVFVDGHAELMHALATGPQITTPQPSETQGRRQMTEGGDA